MMDLIVPVFMCSRNMDLWFEGAVLAAVHAKLLALTDRCSYCIHMLSCVPLVGGAVLCSRSRCGTWGA